MTEEKLKQANDLAEKYKSILGQIEEWKDAVRIKNMTLRSKNGYDFSCHFDDRDFEPIRQVMVTILEERLSIVKLEFENL